MLATANVLAPIFGLILAGWICRNAGVFEATASSQLNRFVVWLALPALLFDVTANATWDQLYQPGFIAAFGLACGLIFAGTVALRLLTGHKLVDASLDGLCAAYANTGYIGFPLCLLAFGPASGAAVTIATIITTCPLFAVAIILVEAGLQSEKDMSHVAAQLARSLSRNPLLLAPILGTVCALSGWHLGGGGETFLKLLSAAASPCALVGLGAFLAEKRAAASSHATQHAVTQPTVLIVGKLVLQPVLTWFLAFRVFALPLAPASTAVLLAALPTGTGPYMLAELYKREALVTSRTILFSTLASILTLSVILLLVASGNLG